MGEQGYGGELVYNALRKSYVFSCSTDAAGACRKKTFAVIADTDLFKGEAKKDVEIPSPSGFVGFESPLVHAR